MNPYDDLIQRLSNITQSTTDIESIMTTIQQLPVQEQTQLLSYFLQNFETPEKASNLPSGLLVFLSEWTNAFLQLTLQGPADKQQEFQQNVNTLSVIFLQEAADRKDPKALFLLGLNYERGVKDHFDRDPQKALALLEESATLNFPLALLKLATAKQQGVEGLIDKNEAEAKILFEKTEATNDAAALFQLAMMHEKENPKKSLELLEKSANAEFGPAEQKLAHHHKEDPQQYWQYITKAAHHNHPPAQLECGQNLLSTNPGQAIEFLVRAQRSNDANVKTRAKEKLLELNPAELSDAVFLLSQRVTQIERFLQQLIEKQKAQQPAKEASTAH